MIFEISPIVSPLQFLIRILFDNDRYRIKVCLMPRKQEGGSVNYKKFFPKPPPKQV